MKKLTIVTEQNSSVYLCVHVMYVYVCLYIYECMAMSVDVQILFILIYWYLSYFHILTIVNNTKMIIDYRNL